MEIFIRRRDSEKGETMKEGNMTFGNIFEAIKRTDDNNKFRKGRQKAVFFFSSQPQPTTRLGRTACTVYKRRKKLKE